MVMMFQIVTQHVSYLNNYLSYMMIEDIYSRWGAVVAWLP